MSKIIKITESQLKNIVGRVLNEQLGLRGDKLTKSKDKGYGQKMVYNK